MIDRLLRVAAVRLLVPPIAGFLFYGAWAYIANMEHGSVAAWRAAFTQGSYSFTVTLVLAVFTEWLFKVMAPVAWRSLWVALIVCVILYITSWSVNALAGTPNILLTILPGAAVSTVYIVLYVGTLRRLSHRQAL